MEIFDKIEELFEPSVCTSDRLVYDYMESQSLECLPIIYQPFEPGEKSHWQTIGVALDFIFSTGGEGKRVLDFGPGDGWPSLIVAPYEKEVVGVESSEKRVDICRKNANRLGMKNTEFVHVPAGEPLPFPDETFDGVMAATSIEQSPEPKETLREFYRVLKTGGKLRINCEPLSRYRDGFTKDTFLFDTGDNSCRLIMYHRDIKNERVHHIGISFKISKSGFTKIVVKRGDRLTYDCITIDILNKLRPNIIDVNKCTLTHPSEKTMIEMLECSGFYDITFSHCGGSFTGRLFDYLPDSEKKMSMEEIYSFLKPIIKVVAEMPAPGGEYQSETLALRATK